MSCGISPTSDRYVVDVDVDVEVDFTLRLHLHLTLHLHLDVDDDDISNDVVVIDRVTFISSVDRVTLTHYVTLCLLALCVFD